MRQTFVVIIAAIGLASLSTAQGADECAGAGAFPLALGANAGSNVGATTSVGYSVPCSTLNSDVWFSFTPAVTDCYRFDTDTAGGLTDTVLAVYESTCTVEPMACDDDGGTVVGLASVLDATLYGGVTYFVQVGDWSTSVTTGPFTLTVTQIACTPDANDLCASATVVGVGTNPAPAASGFTYSMVNSSSEGGYPAVCAPLWRDQWYTFTPATTGIYIVDTETPAGFTAGTLTDTTVAVYTAPCGSAAPLACDADSGVTGGGLLSVLAVNLTAGTTYNIRVGSDTSSLTILGGPTGTYYLTISFLGGPLLNDECGSATALSLGINPTPAASGNFFHNVTATTSAWPAPGCGTIANDVWFTFTPAVSDTYVFDTNNPCGFQAGTLSNTTIVLHDSTMPCVAGPGIACDADTGAGSLSSVAAFLTAGTAYFLQVGPTTAVQGGFYVNVTQGSPFPTNDECVGANPAVTGTNPVPGVSCFTYDNSYATTSAGWSACATLVNDLWFSFTTTTAGDYEFSTEIPAGFTPGSCDDTVVAVYDATCVAGAPLGCDDDSGVTFNGLMSVVTVTLPAATTVMVRVGSFSVSDAGTFYLTITRKMSLTWTSPVGPGSLQVDITAGPSLGTYFLCITFNPAGFPNGYFFGISPSIQEIVSEAGGPPFVGPLNANGDFTIGPICCLPPGLFTLYSVALGFDTAALDVPNSFSTPEVFTP